MLLVLCFSAEFTKTNTTKTKCQVIESAEPTVTLRSLPLSRQARVAEQDCADFLPPEIRRPIHTAGKSKAVAKKLLKLPRKEKKPEESPLKAE